jgi:hypothetical protein
MRLADAESGTPLDAQLGVRLPAKTWMGFVRPGDMLFVNPLWNISERGPNCLPVPCKVWAVQRGVRGCQSGVLFTVRTKGGNDRTLDAGWFQQPNVRGKLRP